MDSNNDGTIPSERDSHQDFENVVLSEEVESTVNEFDHAGGSDIPSNCQSHGEILSAADVHVYSKDDESRHSELTDFQVPLHRNVQPSCPTLPIEFEDTHQRQLPPPRQQQQPIPASRPPYTISYLQQSPEQALPPSPPSYNQYMSYPPQAYNNPSYMEPHPPPPMSKYHQGSFGLSQPPPSSAYPPNSLVAPRMSQTQTPVQNLSSTQQPHIVDDQHSSKIDIKSIKVLSNLGCMTILIGIQMIILSALAGKTYKYFKRSYYGGNYGVAVGVFTMIYGMGQFTVHSKTCHRYFARVMTGFSIFLLVLYGVLVIVYGIATKKLDQNCPMYFDCMGGIGMFSALFLLTIIQSLTTILNILVYFAKAPRWCIDIFNQT